MAEEKLKPKKGAYVDPVTRHFLKGNPGRPKGCGNKPFSSLKQSFIDAFNDPRIGGLEGMVLWILESDEHRQNFYGWITKMLPRTVDVQGVEPVTPTNLAGLKEEELDAVLIGVGKALEGKQVANG